MKKYLIILLVFLFFFNCVSQKKEIISKSTIKLEGKNTNIRNLLDIDGYYEMENPIGRYCTVFFEDGTYIFFHFKEDATKERIRKNMSDWVDSWVKHGQVRRSIYSGVYRIEEDTIIGYFYLNETSWFLWKVWSFEEERYKIIDRKTIQKVYRKSLLKINEDYNRDNNINPWINNGSPLYFSPVDSIPSSDCWLKEEKWIWRHESDWKDYMKKIKRIKMKNQ